MDSLLENSGIFNRMRTSNLYTLFSDNQSVINNVNVLWDDIAATGAGTSTYDPIKKIVTLNVDQGTISDRRRMTYQRFNVSPGKSLLCFMSFKCKSNSFNGNSFYNIGMTDGTNGFSFLIQLGIPKLRVRSNFSGVVTDNYMLQSEWNINRMDGKGNVDNPNKGTKAKLNFYNETQVLVIERFAFPQGYVRFGFMVDGEICWAHQYTTLNTSEVLQFANMNLPLLFNCSGNNNTTDGVALECGSTAVFIEGGEPNIGVLKSIASQRFTYSSASTIYPSIGFQLASTNAAIIIENIAMYLSSANDAVRWGLYRNPTVSGTPLIYSGSGYVQAAQGGPTTTIVAGTGIVTQQGYLTSTQPIIVDQKNIVRLGFNQANIPDQIILGVVALTPGIDIESVITYRELT